MSEGERVVHVLDNLDVGGAQQLVVTHARQQQARGGRLTVVSLGRIDPHGSVARALACAGCELVDLPRPAAGPATKVRDLAALLRSRRPSVVQTHLVHANVYGTLAARLAAVPAVATLHSARVGDDGNSSRALALEGLVLRLAARAVVAVGPSVERAQRRRLRPRRAVVVPNATAPGAAVAPDARRRLRQEITGSPDGTVVLAVGRLVPVKGYHDLLTAFASICADRPDLALVVVGAGELEAELRARIARDGLQPRVRLLGGRDDVPRLLASADVYVSASLVEGLPLSHLEAMAAGLPVVATSVGDVPTVVDATTGVLVPPGRPEQLATALADLVDDRSRREAAGQAGRRRVERDFGVERWAERMEQVYDAAR